MKENTTTTASAAMMGLEQQITALYDIVDGLKTEIAELKKGKMPGYLTYDQVAEHYQVSASTVKNWASAGVLKVHYPHGTKTPRISMTDLIKLENTKDVFGVSKKPRQITEAIGRRGR